MQAEYFIISRPAGKSTESEQRFKVSRCERANDDGCRHVKRGSPVLLTCNSWRDSREVFPPGPGLKDEEEHGERGAGQFPVPPGVDWTIVFHYPWNAIRCPFLRYCMQIPNLRGPLVPCPTDGAPIKEKPKQNPRRISSFNGFAGCMCVCVCVCEGTGNFPHISSNNNLIFLLSVVVDLDGKSI